MWITRRLFNRDNKVNMDTCKRPNIDEEYHCALRTKSCADFFTKLQFLSDDNHLLPSHQMPSECILELRQETINKLLVKSSVLSSKPELKALINNYFDASAEASNICSWLLKCVNQIQSTHQEMQRLLLEILECNPNYKDSHEHFRLIALELNSFVINQNPFSDPKVPTKNGFKLINEKHSSLLHHLKNKRRKMARRIKLAKFFNKATLACLALVFSAATTVTVLLALHTLVALLMGPIALFTIPFNSKKDLKKKKVTKNKKIQIRCIEFVKTELLRRLRGQLDMAAKGTYILNRDFDTMSRLVLSIRDEVERSKAMTQFCLERKGERFEAVQEVVKEIRRSQLGLRKHADELQEHVCLCLVTINRARALVIEEILPSQQIVKI